MRSDEEDERKKAIEKTVQRNNLMLNGKKNLQMIRVI